MLRLLLIVLVCAALNPEPALADDPWPISMGPAVFEFPGGGWGSEYCQCADTRQGIDTSVVDYDEDPELGMVEDLLSYVSWSLEGPGSLDSNHLYTAPEHEGGAAGIIRVADDAGIYADDPAEMEIMFIGIGPRFVEVRAQIGSSWLPQGWPHQNSLAVKARSLDADPVESEGDDNNAHYLPPPPLVKPVPGWTTTKVAMVLTNNPTNLKGICSNFDQPGNPQWEDYDYKWATGSAVVFQDPTEEDGVVEGELRSWDWGGGTTVGVNATWRTPEGDYPLWPIIPFVGANQAPRDKDSDTVPDGYEQTYSSVMDAEDTDKDDDSISDAWEDEDPTPEGPFNPPNTPGDGFAVFDEYRGFVCLSGSTIVYERASPTHKHLFVRDRDGLGIGPAASSGLVIHLISSGMWEGAIENGTLGDSGTCVSGVVNYFGLGSPQKGILLVDAVVSPFPSRLGWTYSTSTYPDPPNAVQRCEVYSQDPYMAGRVEEVVAHEIGHAIDMEHPPGDIEGGIMDNPSMEGIANYTHRSLGEMRLK